MKLIFKGVAWKFGDNIGGDSDIIPYGKVREIFDKKELAKYCMVAIDPDFPKKAKKGDIIVAGEHFGCGYIHVHAIWAMQGLGISTVVAESLPSEGWENYILTEGFPAMMCKGITEIVNTGDRIQVNFKTGTIKNLTAGKAIKTSPPSEYMLKILEVGGFIPYIKKKLERA